MMLVSRYAERYMWMMVRVGEITGGVRRSCVLWRGCGRGCLDLLDSVLTPLRPLLEYKRRKAKVIAVEVMVNACGQILDSTYCM